MPLAISCVMNLSSSPVEELYSFGLSRSFLRICNSIRSSLISSCTSWISKFSEVILLQIQLQHLAEDHQVAEDPSGLLTHLLKSTKIMKKLGAKVLPNPTHNDDCNPMPRKMNFFLNEFVGVLVLPKLSQDYSWFITCLYCLTKM